MTASPTLPVPRRFEERNVPPALQGLVTRVLRSGVVLSGGLLLAGVLWESVVAHGSLLSALAPTGGSGFSSALRHGGPAGLVLLGVIVLLATPLSRVVISTGLFASSGDRTFAGITLFVLAVLATTIFFGILR
jgi:uncharacterized membrane protein